MSKTKMQPSSVCCVFLFSLLGVAIGKLQVTTFVRERGSCGSKTCKAYFCHDDSDCTKTDPNMECVYEYCKCKNGYTREGDKCNIRDRKIGESCSASDDCVGVQGFCNQTTAKCACHSTYKEWDGACYKGYKAVLNGWFEISVPRLTELSIHVSEIEDPFQLLFSDVDKAKDSYNFYVDRSYTTSGSKVPSTELEIVLAGSIGGGVTAPKGVDTWKISWGDSDFTLKIYKYNSDGSLHTPALSNNNKNTFKLSPEIFNITRSDGKKDFIFYPLSLSSRLTSPGRVKDPCSVDDDCKIYHSVCKSKYCDCEPGYSFAGGYCIEAATSVGDHCVDSSQCIKPKTYCKQESCVCVEGYFKNATGDCSNDWKNIGEPCTTNEECKADFSLCKAGICTCQDGYTNYTGTCLKEAHYGDPCSCKGQCVDKGTYCKLKKKVPSELGVCDCKPELCKKDGKCTAGFIVYPSTNDPEKSYTGRNFTADPNSGMELPFKILASDSSIGKFRFFLSNKTKTPESVKFALDYRDPVTKSTGKIYFKPYESGKYLLTHLDPTIDYLTILQTLPDKSIIYTKNAAGKSRNDVELGLGGLGSFAEIRIEVDGPQSLRFCFDGKRLEDEAGDSCLSEDDCSTLDNGECSKNNICECKEGYTNFYGQCIKKEKSGEKCKTLLQCESGFCSSSGTCP